MSHDTCSLKSTPEEPPEDSWTIRRIAERAIRFSILRARHSEATRQQTRQVEAFQGEGGQGG
jgi:hypothetical protein